MNRFSMRCIPGFLVIAVGFCGGVAAEENAIDRYVHAKDAAFRWKIVSTQPGDGVTTFVLDMVSQTWRTPDEVDRTQWQHWLTVVVPDTVGSEIGFVMVGGGSNGGAPPTQAARRLVELAKATGTVVAELGMAPNQPLVFHDDGERRSEDNLIGYAWDQYLKTGDANWLPRGPMTKSVVRAMDAVTAMVGSEAGGKHVVDKFVVAGGSKRGWTTWITGAMDSRVVGIIPIVIDVLNSTESMKHHFAAYGFWAPSIGDYVRHRIMPRMNDPRYEEIGKLVDPLSYRDRLTMPKLILNAAGDQFFLPDSSQFYWDKLIGPKTLRYVPNTDHGMDGSDAFQSLTTFYWLIVNQKAAPQFSWKILDEGKKIVATPSVRPQEVVAWSATNPIARDFRQETLGNKYTRSPVAADSEGNYSVELESPVSGWTATFLEATFDVGGPFPLKMTTAVQVTPNVLPFAGKDPKAEASLTVTCATNDERHAAEVIANVKKLVASGDWKAPELSTEHIVNRLYFNWRPELNRFSSSARALTKVLSDQGCSQFAYQLESGLGATIAPGLAAPALGQ